MVTLALDKADYCVDQEMMDVSTLGGMRRMAGKRTAYLDLKCVVPEGTPTQELADLMDNMHDMEVVVRRRTTSTEVPSPAADLGGNPDQPRTMEATW